MTERQPEVLCFGEVLWDFLPDGLFAGGAPFNVAYHLHQHGIFVQPISAVGTDVLGDELLRRLASWGIPTTGVRRHPALPTGYVRAAVNERGDASYDIVRNVAWDEISLPSDFPSGGSRALIFGSLAPRSAHNRRTLEELLDRMPANAWRVFDVNLRAPFDDLDLVHELARRATLLKLNAAEAARLAGRIERAGDEEAHARELAARTSCGFVCITAGARGAGVLRDGDWYWEVAKPVTVADTVGAGDAFLASLVAQLLTSARSTAAILAQACRIGEWVASQRGATPAYSQRHA